MVAQLAHVLPPLPHASSAVPMLQVFPVQQPGQVESQTHVPMEHCCVMPQGWPRFCH
jgi:hypothetical protein